MKLINDRLEAVLALAATEPAHRPEFFQLLMASSVLVPGKSEQTIIDANATVDLQHWKKENGESVIPFFTSEALMSQVMPDEQPYLIMPVRTLFALTQGATLFLNPELPAGKEFPAREIANLLGEEGNALTQLSVLEGNDSLLLSEVPAPPPQMVDSLTQLFAKHKQVRRAFVASIKESRDGPANLLIGIEADHDVDTVINAAGQVAADTLSDDELIDLCEVKEGEPGISHFFIAHITPFYERRWGSFLRDIKVKMI
ncbi:enhanced serine sensitivity protein SseB [Erwinia sp. OLTSP20]|uniref:enhanced serine sensitivity protein SseB n=1 Tax=unclassified Erwinia TaxID=2622719 RepID=UPI000C65902C|nr:MULTISPECIES: enhanced serine sensitivity protein SseB [unclassified Erwinia]PIJ52313.1 enhanced serine sensitivity protein SseB [Erwinia sp. OAMSP11]PIJ73522.1 enhanced serine sensitivity protein SseB [Erwinia sp. OLSSP12]PIJ85339.1 enhanced serine sensitivity protein SseB [Erwinia sp. OLCASP19]PIJ87581.1 enhanced serine sensitivity protein SseB [Erwinia sp. OLMTSP26]PIJ89088.1 enhanced serine sensitivity protein SseB [Erwinia sp. OLMDSP33]